MSIQSQRSELERIFGTGSGSEIIETFEESKSAKAPGRPIFESMMDRLERGEADGIVAWAPDRLARNSIDGGRIIYGLDRALFRDLKFATYTFENNSQGKFMLSIMFGQSKYYSDALSENVKRGNRTKIENGWRPSLAPIGYLNDAATKTIVKDPVHFPVIRQMFDLMLTGAYTPKQVARIARDDWGFRTPKRRKIGGVPLAMSSVYKILSNPFYAGMILWDGQIYPGRHEPIVSKEEFDRVRGFIQRPSPRRPKRYAFAFTGLIRCGNCGLRITAENKTNRFGSRYIYYHCTNRRLGPRCPEPSVEVKKLEAQIEQFLRSITVNPAAEAWLASILARSSEQETTIEEARRRSLEHGQSAVRAQLAELTGLRVRGLLDDTEFLERRRSLQKEELLLTEKLAVKEDRPNLIEPLMALISFSKYAADWFRRSDDGIKRLILETVGSNPVLKGGILSIQAAIPFLWVAEFDKSPSMLGTVDEVGTLGDAQEPGAALPASDNEGATVFASELAAWFDTLHGAKARANLLILTRDYQREGLHPAVTPKRASGRSE